MENKAENRGKKLHPTEIASEREMQNWKRFRQRKGEKDRQTGEKEKVNRERGGKGKEEKKRK